MALGINQIAGDLRLSSSGCCSAALLAAIDWRAVFWVNVPIGVFGTVWAYRSLHEIGERQAGRIDWPGNLTFAAGLARCLSAITNGIQPYGGHATGWTSPWCSARSRRRGAAGRVLHHGDAGRRPDVPPGACSGSAPSRRATSPLARAIGRGGLQFMLIIWLQGIWLPLHGYAFADTPLWAGIYLLPLTVGFLLAGPVSGYLSDRYGARPFATRRHAGRGGSFMGLLLLPVDFTYTAFALLVALNGIGPACSPRRTRRRS